MMSNDIDKLFRDKLEKHHKAPPHGAWNKLETKLTERSKNWLFLKVAASLLILAIASYVLWPKTHITQIDQAYVVLKPFAKEPTSIKAEKFPNHSKTGGVHNNQSLTTNKITKDRVNSKPTKSSKVNPSTNLTKAEAHVIDVHSKGLINEVAQLSEVSLETVPEDKVIMNEAPAINKSSYTTIIYTVDEVNKKYLDKPIPEATSEEEKPSTFKRLLSKAKKLKNNQDPFGELREKKNEILALNFSKDKRRQ